jgi:hypothetical protein
MPVFRVTKTNPRLKPIRTKTKDTTENKKRHVELNQRALKIFFIEEFLAFGEKLFDFG